MSRPTSTKQEYVYESLRDRIMRGQYGPGYRIVIGAISEEFGVSAPPVREAIRRLEAEGMVVYRAHAGAQVSPAEPGLFEEGLSVLAILEGYATGLAAPFITDEDLAALEEITEMMVADMGRMDSPAFGRHNHEFHKRIQMRCPNASLISVLKDVSRRLDAIRLTVFIHIPYRGVDSIAEHRELIELLRQRAPGEEIERAARQHKLNTVQSFHDWNAENASRI
jgi:DNA-binding GntR family transcriptional regulator